MSARLGRLAKRQPDRVLAGLALLAGACGFVLGAGQDRLGLGGGGEPAALVVRVSGADGLRSPPSQVALEVMRSQLVSDPAVAAVARGPISPGGRRTSLRVSLTGGSPDAAVERIRARLDPGTLTVSFGGGAARLGEVREDALRDLRLLLLAAPLVALLAAAVLGAGFTLAALFAAAAAVLGAGAAAVGLSQLTDVSALAPLGAACAGIPVTALLCGIGPGRTATASAMAAAAVFGAAALLGVEYLAWFAAGGALAALLAIPAAAIAVPAAEQLWGLSTRPRGPASRTRGRLDAVLTGSRPLAAIAAVLSVALLVALALAATRLEIASLAGAPAVLDPQELAGAAAAALIAVAAAAMLAGRRPTAAAAAVLGAAASAGAATGVAVLAFQDGGFDGLLGMRSSAVSLGAVVAAIATVAAISGSQSVAALASRTRPPPGGGPAELEDAAALAALAAVLAGVALTISSVAFLHQFGATVAAGVLIDLLVVRGLLRAGLAALLPAPGGGPVPAPDKVPAR